MKKLVMLAAISSIVFSACAQKLDASKVPAVVRSSFQKAYPGVSAKWEKEDGNYEVNFKQNGNDASVIITPGGVITETETDIKATDLPAAAQAYLKENYKGKNIKESSKLTKAGGAVNYEAQVGNVDVIFDANGKFIKKEKVGKD